MLPTNLSRILSLIPSRRARRLTGTPFARADASACRQGVQFSQVLPMLSWISPVVFLTKEEQQSLGLLAPQARPAQDDEAQDEEEPELA